MYSISVNFLKQLSRSADTQIVPINEIDQLTQLLGWKQEEDKEYKFTII